MPMKPSLEAGVLIDRVKGDNHTEGFPPELPTCRMDCTQGCSHHCSTLHSQGLFLLLTPLRSWGCTENWEGAQLGQVTHLSQGILHTMECHHAQHHTQHGKLGKKQEQGCSEWWVFVFPSHCCQCWSPVSLGRPSTHLPRAYGEWIPDFALLVGWKHSSLKHFAVTH